MNKQKVILYTSVGVFVLAVLGAVILQQVFNDTSMVSAFGVGLVLGTANLLGLSWIVSKLVDPTQKQRLKYMIFLLLKLLFLLGALVIALGVFKVPMIGLLIGYGASLLAGTVALSKGQK